VSSLKYGWVIGAALLAASSAQAAGFGNLGSVNLIQSVDDLNYGIRSGLLASTVASGNCVCQFIEHLDPKACLDRVELQQKAELLTDVVVDERAHRVSVSPNALAQLLVIGGGPTAVAQFDLDHPEYGCMLVDLAKGAK
jgi:hypothetical protein